MIRRFGSVALVLLAIAVFAAAGYVVVHRTRVAEAGRTPPLPSASLSSPPASGTPSTSASSSPAPPPPVVAFLGDDWTSGRGASSKSKRFSTLVCAKIDCKPIVFGVPGGGYARQGSSGGDYASQVPSIVAAQPAMVVVSGGRNDVAVSTTFADDQARRLIAKLHSRLRRATVVVVAPMWGDSAAPRALRDFAADLKKDARAIGVKYLNVPDPIRGHPSKMADAADPNDAGYAAIARALEPPLARLAASLR